MMISNYIFSIQIIIRYKHMSKDSLKSVLLATMFTVYVSFLLVLCRFLIQITQSSIRVIDTDGLPIRHTSHFQNYLSYKNLKIQILNQTTHLHIS